MKGCLPSTSPQYYFFLVVVRTEIYSIEGRAKGKKKLHFFGGKNWACNQRWRLWIAVWIGNGGLTRKRRRHLLQTSAPHFAFERALPWVVKHILGCDSLWDYHRESFLGIPDIYYNFRKFHFHRLTSHHALAILWTLRALCPRLQTDCVQCPLV